MAQAGARAHRTGDHPGTFRPKFLPVLWIGTGHHRPSADRDPADTHPHADRGRDPGAGISATPCKLNKPAIPKFCSLSKDALKKYLDLIILVSQSLAILPSQPV